MHHLIDGIHSPRIATPRRRLLALHDIGSVLRGHDIAKHR